MLSPVIQKLFPHDQIYSTKRTPEVMQKTLFTFIVGILIQIFMADDIAYIQYSKRRHEWSVFKTSSRFSRLISTSRGRLLGYGIIKKKKTRPLQIRF